MKVLARSSVALSDQHARLADGAFAGVGPAATLDDVPDTDLDRVAGMGFESGAVRVQS